MKKIAVITGGAGFIGSHLCERLIREGFFVFCLDNFISGNKKNIRHLLSHKNFRLLNHNVSKYIKIAGRIDYVLHFASPASPEDYLRFPIQTLKVGSLGTHNSLGLAKEKKAKFLLASTSEVYGDPLVHPQPESYWGNVNPVGVRGCYDESKRFAEAITMAYHRVHKIDTKIVRIFNSILADQPVVVFNDHEFHLERIDEYVNGLKRNTRNILVPSFDLKTLKVGLKRVSAVIKHPYKGDAYELKLAYGRTVKVTGDHSVFKKDENGNPVAIPVRQLRVGNHIAIPARLPVIEKDVIAINVTQELINSLPQRQLWEYAVYSEKLRPFIVQKKLKIYQILKSSGRYHAKRYNNGIFCIFNRFRSQGFLPLYVLIKLGLAVPEDAKIRIFIGGAHIYTPNKITLTNEILWLLGFYLAEGCAHYQAGKSYFINFCSDKHILLRAKKILESGFGVHVIDLPIKKKKRGPAIFIHSKILYFIFKDIFKVVKDNDAGLRMPAWILQLPLARLKYVLEGYKDGDGTHSGKKLNKELCFDTASQTFAQQLNMALLRFGIIASYGLYHTTFKAKYGNRRFPFYRLTICELSNFNILKWDKGVKQRLIASKEGDIVWAWIRKIRKCKSSFYVYDFSVPGTENFVAGTGVFCHNTYGPRMRINDGRVIPNFINQALHQKPLTVYGRGRQTRSFCYIQDLVEGIWRLMWANTNEPVNLGNPHEFNILTLAKLVIKLTQTKSRIIFKPLPQDDPKQRRPDISRAKKLLGWHPRVELEEGLKKTIEWFRS
jgi:nucleoside-diphosphate-sugar epimerase